MKYHRFFVLPWIALFVLSGHLLAAKSDSAPPKELNVAPKVMLFWKDLFADMDFVAKMRLIVDARKCMAETDMTLEAIRQREALMAQQWKEQAGPIFSAKLTSSGLTPWDVLGFLAIVYRESSRQQNFFVNRVHYESGKAALGQNDSEFVKSTFSYVHKTLTTAMWGSRAASIGRADDHSSPPSTVPISIEYAQLGGYTPGDVHVAIQNGQAVIVTPGRPSATSKAVVAPDELEYFCALLRIGDFFSFPSSRSPTRNVIIDQPTLKLTVTVGTKTHTADCTDTQDPYLRALLVLFQDIACRQEGILALENAVAVGVASSEPSCGFLRWNTPLRSQHGRATTLVNQLLQRHPEHAVGGYYRGRGTDTLNPFNPGTSLETVDILTAKFGTRDQMPAVVALGTIGDPRAIPSLLNLVAGGDRHPWLIRSLAKLGCRAVLEDALAQENTEALGYLGGDPRAIALAEGKAHGWFTDRDSRAAAAQALAQMGCVPTPTKADLFAHIFAALLILAGVILIVAPRSAASLLANMRRLWLCVAGLAGAAAGSGVLYMLYFSHFW